MTAEEDTAAFEVFRRFNVCFRKLRLKKITILSVIFDVMYQTRETVIHRDIQAPSRELKIRRETEYF